MLTPEEALRIVSTEGPFELGEARINGRNLTVFKNAPASLRIILEQSKRYGDLPFLIYESERLTYAEHYRQVSALAHRFLSIGVKKGDRIAIGMRNYPEWSVSYWATQAIGAVAVPLNAWWTGSELSFALADSEPVLLIVDGERLERLSKHLQTMETLQVIAARCNNSPANAMDFKTLVSDQTHSELPDIDIAPDEVSTILYTSGTTGNPKGAVQTHRNHISNVHGMQMRTAMARLLAGEPVTPDSPSIDSQGGFLQTFPLFHTGGLTGLFTALSNGAKIVLMYKWSVEEALKAIEDHNLTSISGVPFTVRQLLDEAKRTGRSLDSLVAVGSGAAPVPPDLVDQIRRQFSKQVIAGNGYGLTETCGAFIINSGADYFERPSSVGRQIATIDVRIVTEAGRDADPGEVGEIWARGPTVIAGYWRNEAANQAAFQDGWFRTGDLGYVDSDGWYYIVDRKKDVIIRGGENIYCAEVEGHLMELGNVREAALVGVPHDLYGEEVAAVLQVQEGTLSDFSAERICEHLSGRLASFKIPTRIRIVEEDLPRNATGKILKPDLRDKYFKVDPAKKNTDAETA